MQGWEGKSFVDLGSGIGKPSLIAALVLQNQLFKSVGIEFLGLLYDSSLKMK